MNHIAIDLGSRHSQVCIRDERGKILKEKRVSTRGLSRLLQEQKPSRVIVETCTESFAVADVARHCGHEVRVVPATLVRVLGVGQRRMKNDVRDAQVLSEVSCRIEMPSVHIPSAHAREVKALNTSREALVRSRTQLVNRVRAYLRSQPGSTVCATPSTLPARVRTHLSATSDGLPHHIEAVLTVVETLNEQIAQLDRQLHQLCKHDERMTRLRTVPGVGPVTASRFVAAVDTLERFASGAQLASYVGLTPGENTTGFRTQRTSLTKAGPAPLRAALVQAAWSLWRTQPHDPLVLWAQQVAERRGKQIAIIALARKLVLVLFALWRDHSVYQPRTPKDIPLSCTP